jgi:uroporphyrinogen-III synthase
VAELPLAGRRIVVTRPREQATALARALERLGAEVSSVPLVEIRPAVLPDVDPGGYDWLVLTSVNGVAACADLVVAARDRARVAVVGPATADAVRDLGVEPAFVPARFAADEIAHGLGPLDGVRVLLLQADLADPALAETLEARGARVDAVVAYHTVEVEPPADGRAALEGADAIVLASGSAARGLAVLAVGGSALLACIGPKTAAVARQVGLRVGLVAEEATSDGIIRALVAHYEDST